MRRGCLLVASGLLILLAGAGYWLVREHGFLSFVRIETGPYPFLDPANAPLVPPPGEGLAVVRGHVAGNQYEPWFGSVVGFTHGGRRLVSFRRNDSLVVWEVASGRELARVEGPIEAGWLTPRGVRFRAGEETFDLRTCLPVREPAPDRASPRRGPVSVPGGRDVLELVKPREYAGRGTLVRRDADSGAERFGIEAVTDFRVSADGRFVVVLSDRSGGRAARLRDLATGAELRRFEGEEVWALAVSPDDRRLLVGGFYCDAATEWEIGTGRRVADYRGHTYDEVLDAAWSPDGTRLLTVDGEPFVILRHRGGTSRRQRFLTGGWPLGFPRRGPGFRLGTPDGAFQLRDEDDGRVLRGFPASPSPVLALAESPAGAVLATGHRSGAVRQWDAGTAAPVAELPPPGDAVRDLAWSPDGRRILAATSRGEVHLLGADPLRRLATLLVLADGSWAILAPDGRFDASHDGDPPGIYWLEDRAARPLRESPLRRDPTLRASIWR